MKAINRVFFALIPLFILPIFMTSARAQENAQQKPDTEKSKPVDVEQLKSKVEQLQSFVEQQQRLILELQNRVDEMTNKARPAALVTPAKSADAEAVLAVNSQTTQSNATTKDKPNTKDSASSGQAKPAEKPVVVAGWDAQSAFLRSADGNFETRVTGFAQLDFRGYSSGAHPPNTYAIRRARMRFDGKLGKYYDYRIEGEMADTTSILLRDFYLRIHRVEEAQLTIGQFREPFSQEELRPEPSQDFVEKSLVNLMVPARSPGLMLSGVFNKGTFEYQIGSFNGKGLLRENNTGTPENALRVRFAPWKNGNQFWLKGLAFGGAFAQGKTSTTTSFRGQTSSRSFVFFTPDTVSGKVIRANGELTWLLGPAVLRAEYDQVNQDRDNLGVNGRNLPGLVTKGYMAQFTYLLTGETKPDNGVTVPKHSLFSTENGKPGFGALEFKARFDDLQISDGTAKSNRAQTLYIGTNWYLSRFVKHMLDFGFERFKDPLRSPNPAEKNYFVILSRIQVAF